MWSIPTTPIILILHFMGKSKLGLLSCLATPQNTPLIRQRLRYISVCALCLRPEEVG